jgi:exodeoxyribonuclease V alpha subunit
MTPRPFHDWLRAPGWEPVDLALAGFVERVEGRPVPAVALAAALASRALRDGHSYLDLATQAGQFIGEDGRGLNAPPITDWLQAMDEAAATVGEPGEGKPLTLTPTRRLYLTRVWNEEQSVALKLRELAAAPPSRIGASWQLAPTPTHEEEPDWQTVALWAAARRGFVVISGGPGSGKTRVTARLLRHLLESGEAPSRIAVAAPTGKAANRLQTALAAEAPELAARIQVVTLHRLLGASAAGNRFRFGPDRPLPSETVIVDEASMVDLTMMHRLLGALRPRTRLVLVGDKDQLPSVDAGNVLGDVCDPGAMNAFPAKEAAALSEDLRINVRTAPAGMHALSGSLIELRRNYRFGSDSPIATLAARVRAGDGRGVRQMLEDLGPLGAGVAFAPLPDPAALPDALAKLASADIAAPAKAQAPAEALQGLGKFRILCAVREGPWGVVGLNTAAGAVLRRHTAAGARVEWPRGRQVVVTVNDYEQGLSNGDLGVAWGAGSEPPTVFFDGADGPRRFPTVRLPAFDDAWALTVHKAQGSEFERVLVVVPAPATDAEDRFWSGPGRILCREWIYTAITRARRRVIVWADPSVVESAVSRRIERRSGLRDALAGIRALTN